LQISLGLIHPRKHHWSGTSGWLGGMGSKDDMSPIIEKMIDYVIGSMPEAFWTVSFSEETREKDCSEKFSMGNILVPNVDVAPRTARSRVWTNSALNIIHEMIALDHLRRNILNRRKLLQLASCLPCPPLDPAKSLPPASLRCSTTGLSLPSSWGRPLLPPSCLPPTSCGSQLRNSTSAPTNDYGAPPAVAPWFPMGPRQLVSFMTETASSCSREKGSDAVPVG
jgi:hypothetical protein